MRCAGERKGRRGHAESINPAAGIRGFVVAIVAAAADDSGPLRGHQLHFGIPDGRLRESAILFVHAFFAEFIERRILWFFRGLLRFQRWLLGRLIQQQFRR